MAQNQTNAAATKAVTNELWVESKNTTFKALMDKCRSLITSSAECRKNGRQVAPELKKQGRQESDSLAVLQATGGAKASSQLVEAAVYDVKWIDHYTYSVDSSLFSPVHSPAESQCSVRMYKGDFIETAKMEKVRGGSNGLVCDLAYIDGPWGVHRDRKEDAFAMPADDVSIFPFNLWKIK